MWQQSGTLLFCSCHGIAGFLVDELQIWIWRHFLEVLPDMTLIFTFKKEYIIFVKMCFNIEHSCHTITNIKHGRRLSLQLMTNWSLTCNYSNSTQRVRLAPMWQQSGTLLFCSCHGIAGFLVDALQIWIWRHFLEVLPKMMLIFFSKKN